MDRICVAATVTAFAGGSASLAQPVARHLIDDADAVEVLYHQQVLADITLWASLHLLDDLDADGVRDVLLTHAKPLPPNPESLAENFKAFVRSSRSGDVLLEFPPDDTKVLKTAHAAAVMIDDINDDAVRDIAAGRSFLGAGGGIGLRVHSGATGEVLRAPYADNIQLPYGVSMIPWDDMDDDGQPDLLLGSLYRGANFPFAYWSPGSGAFTNFRPIDYPSGSTIVNGFALLHLGIGDTGVREVLSTTMPDQGGFVGFGFAMLGDNPLRVTAITPDVPVVGAVRLEDLGGDGRSDVVLATGWQIPGEPPVTLGIPVLSGELPDDPFEAPTLSAIHEPRMVVDFGQGPETVRAIANHAITPLGDATGDGFPDYAFLGYFEQDPPDESGNFCIVAMCGRTGTAYFAAEQQVPFTADIQVLPTRSLNATGGSVGRDALVSPGDINNDGAPDLLLLVARTSGTVAPPLREQLLLTHYLPTPCVGDTDFDRAVDFTDLNTVLSNFGAHDITSPADLNASGAVDFTDLNLVLSAFGSTCD